VLDTTTSGSGSAGISAKTGKEKHSNGMETDRKRKMGRKLDMTTPPFGSKGSSMWRQAGFLTCGSSRLLRLPMR
jgi:hypothetical protein